MLGGLRLRGRRCILIHHSSGVSPGRANKPPSLCLSATCQLSTDSRVTPSRPVGCPQRRLFARDHARRSSSVSYLLIDATTAK